MKPTTLSLNVLNVIDINDDSLLDINDDSLLFLPCSY